jgi:hypothetical protein
MNAETKPQLEKAMQKRGSAIERRSKLTTNQKL